jgi:hypothetical protein
MVAIALGEAVEVLTRAAELVGERRTGVAEARGRRVVARREPPVAAMRHAAQPGGGAPARDPQGRRRRGTRFQRAARAEERAQLVDRVVEAPPALGEGHAGGLVVAR